MAREVVCGIYKITSPSGKIYIGQSKDVLLRFTYYRRLACKKQFKLYNSFNKHGVENHIFEIIETCNIEELNKREVYYMTLFNTFNTTHGLNCRIGGEGKIILSDDTRERISLAQRGEKSAWWGKRHSEETIKKMREASLRRSPPTKETREKMSKSRIGIVVSEITREKRRLNQLGKWNIYCAKGIVQYDIWLNEIKIWESARCVQRSLGINQSLIGKCCRFYLNKGQVKSQYKIKSAGGFVWKFLNDNN